MHDHITEVSATPVDQPNHSSFLAWLNRLLGMIAMFIACLAICHFAGLIHLSVGHF